MGGFFDGWFTIEQLDDDTFALSEYGHWEETHCYLLLGSEKALLIDTGLGVADIGAAVRRLAAMPVLAAVTHAHWDHIGGLKFFSRTAGHEAELGWLSGEFPLPLPAVKQNLTRQPCRFPEGFRLDDYTIFRGGVGQTLRDGDCLELGGRAVTVLHTPGHSPGHCCFYERERGYLFSGDLIYGGCLDAFYPTTDPALFLRSVERVEALAVERVWPGHHRLDLPVDIIGRVGEALRRLEREGRLDQGAGVFDFGDFQIHL